MTIKVTRGLPGSGKSTWAKTWVAADQDNRARVNRDDIRITLFGRTRGVDENLVSRVEEHMVREAAKAGKDVVIDAMHLKAAYVKRWQKFGTVELVDFPVPVDFAVEQDRLRGESGGNLVGEDVIRGIAKRFHIPPEGTLPKIDLTPVAPFEFKPAPPYSDAKPNAIIVDIDGTLAKMNGKRGPYDTHLYHLDDVERNLQQIVNYLSLGYNVLITSGRSEDFRAVTEDWLRKQGVCCDRLLMRKSGDLRNDAIVKHDLFHERIAPYYNVIMAFDDRDRVVDAWREMGITTAQMDYGDF